MKSARDADRRDEGAVLPLVLVMMVIAALIVIPLLGYSVSVLRANQVVSDSSRDREAAEGGLRVALLESTSLFAGCIGASKSVAMPTGGVVSSRSVAVNCTLADEVGPANVLGYGNPASAALQLGSTVPVEFLGTVKNPPDVPPYPGENWWDHTVTATDGEIWLPQLPTAPGTDRTSTPFDMPPAFGCKVYLPGRYSAPVTISTGNVYFASGVYYFEQPVTISGDADVVVGYGLEELPNGCADDVQVGANLLGSPGVFGIDGAGATWVFGAEGRLVVNNEAAGSGPSLRFNQRYVETGYEAERGGRISIVSVNGDDSSGDHVVPRVVSVPRTTVAVNGQTASLGESGATYTPSASTLTSEAREPAQPGGLSVTPFVVDGEPSSTAGVLRVEWDEVTGQDAGGALIDGYGVTWTRNGQAIPQPVCTDPASIVVVDDPGDGTPRRLACTASGLRTNSTYRIAVAAHNDAGFTSPAATLANIEFGTGTPSVAAPDAPTIDLVTAYDGAAEISWTPGADNGAPITAYAVRAERVYLAAQDGTDDDGQPLPAVEQHETLGGCAATTTDLWQPAATNCIIEPLTDLLEGVDPVTGDENLGYRFVVTATNAIGESPEHIHDPDPAVFAFDGDPVPAPAPPVDRVVEPWIPTPIVDLQVGGPADTRVTIPGYIAVPMGRISVDNPEQQTVQLIGGLLASTFWRDSTTADGVANSADLGYQSEIVLQRKIRLVATAGGTRASAVVQINEDGNFAVNSWVVQ